MCDKIHQVKTLFVDDYKFPKRIKTFEMQRQLSDLNSLTKCSFHNSIPTIKLQEFIQKYCYLTS